jgi:hypothetical protein
MTVRAGEGWLEMAAQIAEEFVAEFCGGSETVEDILYARIVALVTPFEDGVQEGLEQAAMHWPIGELGTLTDFRCSCGATLDSEPDSASRIAAWKIHIRNLATSKGQPTESTPVIRCRSCGGTLMYVETVEGYEVIHACKDGKQVREMFASECERGRRDRVTPKMMSEVFAQSVNATDSGHEHLYDHRIAAELLNKMLAATSGTPAEHNPARAPHNKFASLWCDACPRPASGTPAARTEIFSKANRLAKATNQVVGEKHDLYVTLEQLMEIL